MSACLSSVCVICIALWQALLVLLVWNICLCLVQMLQTRDMVRAETDLFPSLSYREKSKKFAEQAAAIVCLRVLGVPEGRLGEDGCGLVSKRKRDGEESKNGEPQPEDSPTPEVGGRKRHISQSPQKAEEPTNRTDKEAVINGSHRHQTAS